ncbi:MAG: hypothetical protein KME64_40275 [Scytonematopsis contorta HA4267-MV1]|jgi:hypothetical protein|nr:hypothetical protein [Scytonematopsis contorta HA4267-MV1]
MIHEIKGQSIGERQISQLELEQYIQEQANSLKFPDRSGSGFQLLANATENIISHAKWLANQKTILNKLDYKKLVSSQGWKSKEEKRYLKVASAFEKFSPENLSLVEPATIFQLANNRKKYKLLLEQLADLPEINQAVVRDLIKTQGKSEQQKEEKFSIWRLTPKGERYCQIPPIREESQRTGMILQQMMDTEGKTAQAIVAEALELRRAYMAGELTLDNENISVNEPEISLNDNLSTDDILEEDFQTEDRQKDEESLILENTTIENFEKVFVELSAVEVLIQTLQNATHWEEVRDILQDNSDYKQEAWDALTLVERQRVMRMMPVEIQKLSKAKYAKKIADFKEIKDGVYQVLLPDSFSWKIVTKSGLDNFLSQL